AIPATTAGGRAHGACGRARHGEAPATRPSSAPGAPPERRNHLCRIRALPWVDYERERMSLHRYSTLIEAFDANQRNDRDVVFIDADDKERRHSFAELRLRALGTLHHLQTFGRQPRDELILHLGDN